MIIQWTQFSIEKANGNVIMFDKMFLSSHMCFFNWTHKANLSSAGWNVIATTV